jgi:CBS domain-containing protein
MNREPNYRTEYDRSTTGWGAADYGRGNYPRENYERDYSDSGRWGERDRSFGREGSYSQGAIRSHLRCRDIMTRNVTTVRRDTPISEVARIMKDEDIGAVPVIGEDGRLEGIVTDRDLVVRGLNSEKDEAELRAEDCMTDDLYTANQNDRLVEVISEMGDHQVRRVPVVDSRNRLVGIISMADVSLQTSKDAELADAMEDISKPSSWLARLSNLFNW